MTDLRVILLTGDQPRHRYVAAQLSESLKLVGVVSEARKPVVGGAARATLSADDMAVIDRHFAERDAAEQRWLGANAGFPSAVERLTVASGEANAPAVYAWVTSREPDYVLLYGTSIIKPPLLTHYEGRMINLHLGLSPYYRGAGTNFWALVNGEPECVGATIHLAVAEVDAGSVLGQVRPTISADDRAHDIGTKTIIAAVEVIPQVLRAYHSGKITPRPQTLSGGRVYRNRDFTADSVRRLWHNFDGGMVTAYLADQQARQGAYPIVTVPDDA